MKKIIADEEVLRSARMIGDFFENVKERGRKAKKGILPAMPMLQQKIGIPSYMYMYMYTYLGASGWEPYTFLVFVASSLVFLYFTIRFVPETKGLTVAQITEQFNSNIQTCSSLDLLTVGKLNTVP